LQGQGDLPWPKPTATTSSSSFTSPRARSTGTRRWPAFVRAYPDLREDALDHWCEIVLMEFRAAAYPEPPYLDVDEGIAARALARLREQQAALQAWCETR
jgi:hypothetical protein